MCMTYGHTEILHKTDDFFLLQKKRIYRNQSAWDTAARINIYFQHYIEDTAGDLTKSRDPLSGRLSLYIQSLTDSLPGKH